MKKTVIGIGILVSLVMIIAYGLPVFAQSYVATLIPGQPLSKIAAQQIIENSGLPIETLEDGTTGYVTRGRDAVNAYRLAHDKLSENGWYKGLSDDHTPLLEALLSAMEKEGYISGGAFLAARSRDILSSFWGDSNDQNAKELGYDNEYELIKKIDRLTVEGRYTSSHMLNDAYYRKWQ